MSPKGRNSSTSQLKTFRRLSSKTYVRGSRHRICYMKLTGKFVAKLGEEYIPLVLQRHGETGDEAIAKCLEAARQSIYCELVIRGEIGRDCEGDIGLPYQDVLSGKCPKETPDGFVPFIAAQCKHKALNPYRVRYFALPHASKINEGDGGFEITVTKPVKVEFRDISPEAIRAFHHLRGSENHMQHVSLPEGSLEYVDGKWIVSARAIYAVRY